jgi:hypothetical protein
MAQASVISRTRYHDEQSGNNMKEVLTKSFWEGVRKTFDQALKGPTTDEASQTQAEGDVSESSTSKTTAGNPSRPKYCPNAPSRVDRQSMAASFKRR